MSKDPQQRTRPVLTGTAQPVTNSVERARAFLKERPEPSRPPAAQRKNFRQRKPEPEGGGEPSAEPAANQEGEGENAHGD